MERAFLAVRFLAGMFSGSAGMAMAYISQVCAPVERPKYFPYVGTIIMTAFALGPGFGAGISSLTDDPLFKGQLPMKTTVVSSLLSTIWHNHFFEFLVLFVLAGGCSTTRDLALKPIRCRRAQH